MNLITGDDVLPVHPIGQHPHRRINQVQTESLNLNLSTSASVTQETDHGSVSNLILKYYWIVSYYEIGRAHV